MNTASLLKNDKPPVPTEKALKAQRQPTLFTDNWVVYRDVHMVQASKLVQVSKLSQKAIDTRSGTESTYSFDTSTPHVIATKIHVLRFPDHIHHSYGIGYNSTSKNSDNSTRVPLSKVNSVMKFFEVTTIGNKRINTSTLENYTSVFESTSWCHTCLARQVLRALPRSLCAYVGLS